MRKLLFPFHFGLYSTILIKQTRIKNLQQNPMTTKDTLVKLLLLLYYQSQLFEAFNSVPTIYNLFKLCVNIAFCKTVNLCVLIIQGDCKCIHTKLRHIVNCADSLFANDAHCEQSGMCNMHTGLSRRVKTGKQPWGGMADEAVSS